MSLLGAVEAAIFAAGGPIPIKELSLIVGSPAVDVEEALKVLKTSYRERESGLEIVHQAGGYWAVQVHRQYLALVHRLVPPELEPGATKTLSLIAFLQPVTQAQVVERRGASAYNHIRELAKKGFVTRERQGNSYLLKTTQEFARRFRLKDDPEAIRQAMLVRESEESPQALADAAAAIVGQLEAAVGGAGEPPVAPAAPTAPVGEPQAPSAEQPAAVPSGPPEPEQQPVEVAAAPRPEGDPAPEPAWHEPSRADQEAQPSAAPVAPEPAAEQQPEPGPAARITRLTDHRSLRRRVLEGRDKVIWTAEKKRA